jgi:hypothetical protein
LEKDPSFQIYAVIFGVTATTKSTPPAVRLASLGSPSKGRGKSDRRSNQVISEADAAKIIPDAWIKAAKKKIQAEPPKPKMKDGKPVEVFTYFFYIPTHPNVVVVDPDKPLDKQP